MTNHFYKCFLQNKKAESLYGNFMNRVASNHVSKRPQVRTAEDSQSPRLSKDLLNTQMQSSTQKEWQARMQQFHSGSGVIKESGKDDIVDIKLESRLLRSKLPPATAGPMLSRAKAHETQLPSISHDKPLPKRIDILNKKFHKFFKHVRKLPQQTKPQTSPEKAEEGPAAAKTYRENVISQDTISRFRLHRATFVNNRHNSIEHESPEQTTIRDIKEHALDPCKIDTT
jgi:hypothetical protein